jgi:hypothetical protein
MPSIPSGLVLAKVSCEVRVTPGLVFYEQLIPMGRQLEGMFRHWRTDTLSVRLLDADSRSAVALRHNQFVLEVDLPKNSGVFDALFRRVAPAYLKSSHIKKVLRTGVRGQYFCTMGFKFEELVSIFADRLYRVSPQTNDFLKGRMQDLMFNAVVERADYILHIIAGPVRREEMDRWTKAITYEVGDPPEPIEYPEVATFIDLDVYTRGELPVKEVDDFVAKALDVIPPTAKSLSSYLFEDKP